MGYICFVQTQWIELSGKEGNDGIKKDIKHINFSLLTIVYHAISSSTQEKDLRRLKQRPGDGESRARFQGNKLCWGQAFFDGGNVNIQRSLAPADVHLIIQQQHPQRHLRFWKKKSTQTKAIIRGVFELQLEIRWVIKYLLRTGWTAFWSLAFWEMLLFAYFLLIVRW